MSRFGEKRILIATGIGQPDTARREFERQLPLGCAGTAESVVLFLLSEEAFHVTGRQHAVDGGGLIMRRIVRRKDEIRYVASHSFQLRCPETGTTEQGVLRAG